MKKPILLNTLLPLAKPRTVVGILPTGEAFRPEWIDFQNGIRVGNIEPHERITRILKYHLEERYRTPFVTDRWGRGVYWQWICWLPRANREAKPLSHDVNFGCAKLFITVEREERRFKAGLQIERGYVEGPEADRGWGLKKDWDWHRLLRHCRTGSALDAEFGRLLRQEEFEVAAGDSVFTRRNFTDAAQVAKALRACPRDDWAGFQLYYSMPEREVSGCTGHELVQAVRGIFTQVVPAMNLCMQVPLTTAVPPHEEELRPGSSPRFTEA
jgi:hypothetical protein